jgi:hypothetical protein
MTAFWYILPLALKTYRPPAPQIANASAQGEHPRSIEVLHTDITKVLVKHSLSKRCQPPELERR